MRSTMTMNTGMLRFMHRALCAMALAMITASAHANFHLWEIDQVFSDASGNVQYVRFSALSGGQQSLSGHNVVSSLAGNPSKTYAFTTNLPGDSTGKKFLLATQGFAALNIVTPDYVVPNGFLFTPDGTITFAGGADILTYLSLPSNGTQAITRTGAIVTATPINFAGQTGQVNVPPPVQAGAMDIDQNGKVDALTDGLLLLRYAFGLRGNALIAGAIGTGAARKTAQAIEAYLADCLAKTGVTC